MSASENLLLPADVPATNAPAPLDARRTDPVRVRQLCPAGVTPGLPWRNGVVPLAAYVIYTPTHALAAGSYSLPALG
ncbi:hypothetical protein [Oleiharenicola sp. Vm1]|uniref:hypothetical protein n=1 Tax=Oleiharenicola sp. Vm1 TaxID=3398393 RepID=UPI0039F51028